MNQNQNTEGDQLNIAEDDMNNAKVDVQVYSTQQ